ncbi:fimbria/pilus outer membrane usher protein [Vulcaniibacterium gelatinicum]|uniref:fimbria/pilus outer membrane usher protein n=1 Tax=Vulcaniibacterium gelatinicum TaxID=2598725 RepID=UPI0011C93895|nr:fimbria/pilus outer membrane usher protein [Vulcaniibacterium gelatinicum]
MRRLKRPALALALAGVLAAMPVAAQPGDEVLLLDLCVDARCVGVAAVVVRDGRVLVDREALLAAGLDPTGLAAERIGERDFVDPSALGGVTVRVDREALRVDIERPLQARPVQQADLRTRVAADPLPQPWTAFVNYALTVGERREQHSAYFDAALGRGHAALRSTGFWNQPQGWRRGLTRFEFDQPQHLRRWTVGDQFAVARDALGGGLLLGGVGMERAFEQDPYLVTFPQAFYQGVLETPGTVEVYANGVLVGRRELGPGPFTLQNLGLPPGRSDLQVVVRDPFGNRFTLPGQVYYGASQLLAPGLTDYAVRMGVPRSGVGLDDRYTGGVAWQAWWRHGFTDRLTVGARGEGDRDLRNLGADLALRSGFGEFGFSFAASDHAQAGSGQAWAASYSYGDRRYGLALGTRRFSAGYRNLGEPLAFVTGRLREDDYATVSWAPWSPFALQLGYGRQRREGEAAERNASLVATWRLSGRAQLQLAVQHRQGLREDTSALLGFTYAFDRESLSLSARRDEAGESLGLDLRRSRPPGVGWGYELSAQRLEDTQTGIGQVEYQGRHGRYAARVERFAGATQAYALASGALVAIGGRMFATPPLETGFALVRAPGLADAPVLRENVEVGRTDARGDLLVRDLVPYYPNLIALDAAAVPIRYDIRRGAWRVAVPRNAGALVPMDVQVVQAVTGQVRVRAAGVTRAAEYGRLRVRAADTGAELAETPLGGSGRYYLDGLAPGRYRAEVLDDAGAVAAVCLLSVPTPGATPVAELGELICDAVGETP